MSTLWRSSKRKWCRRRRILRMILYTEKQLEEAYTKHLKENKDSFITLEEFRTIFETEHEQRQ